jgi:hypothetical protein
VGGQLIGPAGREDGEPDEVDGLAQAQAEHESLGRSAKRCPVCGVRLSLYNPGPNCWQHTIGQPWRGPSAKPR